MLAGVDHFVDLAFHVTELVLLGSQLVWLAQRVDLLAQTLNLLAISSILHLKVIVVFNQLLDLLLESFLVHCFELFLETSVSI